MESLEEGLDSWWNGWGCCGGDQGSPFALEGDVDGRKGADAVEVGGCVRGVRREAEREAGGYKAVDGDMVGSPEVLAD